MTSREQTQQQLDPAGGFDLRRAILLMLAVLPLLLLTVAVVRFLGATSPVTSLLAIGLIATACAVLAYAVRPARAPVRRGTHIGVLALAVAALVVDVSAGWSADPTGRNNLIPIAIGILTLALGPYRPSAEIAIGGGLCTALVGIVAFLHAEQGSSTVLPWIHVVSWAAPVLAMSAGAAVFGSGIVRELERWRSEAASRVIERVPEVSQEIRREVQRNRVDILNRDVVPLFARVIEAGEVTERDRAEAAGIAAAMRGVMLADVDRNWLESGVARFLPGPTAKHVSDPERLSSVMTVDERAALRAFLLAINSVPTFNGDGFRIQFTGEPRQVHCELQAHLNHRDRATRSILDPYLAVMRVIFPGVVLRTTPSAIRLEFSYGRT